MEVARAERVRFQKRDVSTEFQSKKLRTRNLRGNSRLQTFSSLLLFLVSPRMAFYPTCCASLTLSFTPRLDIYHYDIAYVVYKLIKMIIVQNNKLIILIL